MVIGPENQFLVFLREAVLHRFYCNQMISISTYACFQILLIFSLYIMLLYTWIEVNKIMFTLTHISLASFFGTYANRADPDQHCIMHNVLSELDLHCLQNVLLKFGKK